MASPLPRSGGELHSAPLSSLTAAECRRCSPGSTARQQSRTSTKIPSILTLPIISCLNSTPSSVNGISLYNFSGDVKSNAGPEVLSTVLLFKLHCTCIHSASLFVKGQSVEKVRSCSTWPSPFLSVSRFILHYSVLWQPPLCPHTPLQCMA